MNNMEYTDKEYCLEIWGDWACFTRPELKVERVSYPVITPSACRAIFEAILWKPAIAWQIHKIEVLKPIEWLSIRRNEVGKKMSKMFFYGGFALFYSKHSLYGSCLSYQSALPLHRT